MLTATTCPRCHRAPRGSFTDVCVQCSSDVALGRPAPTGPPEPSTVDTTDWSPEEVALLEAHRSGATVVVNLAKSGHPNLVEWAQREGVFTYCGRAIPRRRLAASKWANPHRIDRGAPDQTAERRRVLTAHRAERRRVLTAHRATLTADPELVDAIPELQGRILGCWCAPAPCHAHLLAAAADGRLTL